MKGDMGQMRQISRRRKIVKNLYYTDILWHFDMKAPKALKNIGVYGTFCQLW